ncbi:MAG: TrkH family potassium uptake protein [Clostridiales bacterium]|jgi:trk system potassium uptake protein TrkH|nr:TrkH family potassium uptake protein [Clostridiales bacterium]
MNLKLILRTLGMLLLVEAVCMVPSLFVSLAYGQGDWWAFVFSILATGGTGAILRLLKPKVSEFYAKDGFALVGLSWLAISVFGAIPYILGHAMDSPADALFESVSGFSTTTASVLDNIESLPHGIIFWRSFTNWLGGMGILMLLLAAGRLAKPGSFHIVQAETPGPYVEKFSPKMGRVAKLLYIIYAGITVVIALMLMAGGMSLFDAVVHALGTVSTGGISSKNYSVGEFGSVYVNAVVGIFMFLCGARLSAFKLIFEGKWKEAIFEEETKFYFFIALISTALIAADLALTKTAGAWDSVLLSSFQVSSSITSTGFYIADYNKWPLFSKIVLLFLILMGGCSGSTSGGLKSMRALLLLKSAKLEMEKILHPKLFAGAKLNGKVVSTEDLTGVHSFFFLYIAVIAVASAIISLDGLDVTTTVSAAVAALSNIGTGFGAIGPGGNYSGFSGLSKMVLSFCMLLGRLEIYPALILFMPKFWRKSNI